MTHGARVLLALGVASALAGACARKPQEAGQAVVTAADPLAELRAFEESRRKDARFLEAPVQDRAFGADPYDLVGLDGQRLAGILRGADAIVLLDRELHEIVRAATPRAPSAIAVYQGRPAGELAPGDLLVASEVEPVLAHYRGPKLERLADVPLGDAFGVRGLATGREGVVYVVEEHDDRLITLGFTARRGKPIERHELRVRRGPLRVVRTGQTLFVSSVLDHSICAFRVDASGRVTTTVPTATATMEGPFWGFDAIPVAADGGNDALLLAGGPEDHPLDRKGGFFGYVDSFVYVYRWTARSGELSRVAAINAGEQGLIVPKGIAFARSAKRDVEHPSALVTSYGAPAALRLSWKDGVDRPPTTRVIKLAPGASAAVATPDGFALADPLLDSWITVNESDEPRVARVELPGDTRSDQERIGEALFFTGLMAPSSSSDGAKSRFSCETCHFEGFVDGRTHHTGRGDIRATTKPLVGLFNNRPHFSRALDPDLSSVAENEFRVAGAPSPADPHFEVDVKEVSWLAHLRLGRAHFSATELRLSLMSFLMRWTHRTNPRAATTRPFSSEERSGALAFHDRCERCHEARAAADDPSSRVPFERWESLVLGGGGPIVWASDRYEKSGILPYVHENGARVTSLRRVYKKRPYFTNGAAPDIMSVLRGARFTTTTFSHGGTDEGDRLDEATAHAIAAFVDLL